MFWAMCLPLEKAILSAKDLCYGGLKWSGLGELWEWEWVYVLDRNEVVAVDMKAGSRPRPEPEEASWGVSPTFRVSLRGFSRQGVSRFQLGDLLGETPQYSLLESHHSLPFPSPQTSSIGISDQDLGTTRGRLGKWVKTLNLENKNCRCPVKFEFQINSK